MVSQLKEISFKVFFEHLMSQALSGEFTTKRLRQFYADWLTGSVRAKLFEAYSLKLFNLPQYPDLCTFLDFILESPSRLTIESDLLETAGDEEASFFPNLVAVIADRSPLLQSLSIGADAVIPLHLTADETLFNSLFSLKHLKKLELGSSAVVNSVALYSHLGSSCPYLHLKLDLTSNGRAKEESLSLILGMNKSLIAQHHYQKMLGHSTNLHCLEFHERFLSPICNTLISFSSSLVCDEKIAVFLFRHLKKLQILNVEAIPNAIPNAVKMMHMESYRPAAPVVIRDVGIQWTLNPVLQSQFYFKCIFLTFYSRLIISFTDF